MKSIINSFIIAFSMYSKVPMPKASWEEDHMKYVMCFFPLVGALIGAVLFGWNYIGNVLSFSRVFQTIIMILIPIVITGGIHMDGFLDTTDALKSYQSVEKKLDILKDPHTGAFAVIACIGYYLLTFGVWYDMKSSSIPILAISFLLSRALSGLAVVTFPLAKNSGLVATFSNQAKKKITKIAMLLFIIMCGMGMILVNLYLGIVCFLSAIGVFVYCRHMAIKEFGGITGDIAGYFLQVCELIMAVCVMLGGKLCG
jgi:adenosylcobinamide-GDP ribazoletransferase